MSSSVDLLAIGGRCGVGKSTVAFALSRLLADAGLRHAVIEGDNLDQAWPPPSQQGVALAEQNLHDIWRNYAVAGYRRLVYTNTVSVLELDRLTGALGGQVRAVGVLLGAADATAEQRLERREHGNALAEHVQRSARAAAFLEERADGAIHRVGTDGRDPEVVAAEILALCGWGDEAAAGTG